jgi:T4-like virus Myoviridae tail sheath stabiliser
MQQFFYDAQIRRFLLQITRIFSGFQVEYGNENDGVNAAALIRVPVRYGDATRNAQTIIQENSRNSLPSTPLITFYITGLDYEQSRTQEPYFVSKVNVRQRTYDSATETYETTQGNAFTVERLMPVPFKLTVNVDIWTSNTNQKLQLLEQILTLFNPSLEIQSTDNYIDWTSLSVMYLDRTVWSSRTVPMGTENPIDIATLTFSMPIWISPPAKVKKLGVVERVVASIYDAQGDLNDAITNNDLLLGTRLLVTPWNYKLVVIENQIQCLYAPTIVPDGSLDTLVPTQIVAGSSLLWPALINAYGVYRPGISQIRLDQADGSVIVGTIVINPNDNRLVIFDVDPDTAPQNSLAPIDAIINPLLSAPEDGLDSALLGQRYLLTEGTGDYANAANPTAWAGTGGQPLVASANDIIEFDGTRWRVVFVSSDQPTVNYVTNIHTGTQYEWTGQQWIKSYQGVYEGGAWSIVL